MKIEISDRYPQTGDGWTLQKNKDVEYQHILSRKLTLIWKIRKNYKVENLIGTGSTYT